MRSTVRFLPEAKTMFPAPLILEPVIAMSPVVVLVVANPYVKATGPFKVTGPFTEIPALVSNVIVLVLAELPIVNPDKVWLFWFNWNQFVYTVYRKLVAIEFQAKDPVVAIAGEAPPQA